MARVAFLLLIGLKLSSLATAQSAVEVPVKLAEVVVTPSRFGVTDTAAATAGSLTAADLEVLPQLGDDLFRSIARLPGLAADDISAQFWVRGAPQTQLLARLDGVDLLEPFHLKDVGGALSLVDPALIQRLDLATGGFTVEHGDRLGGVLTMETKTAATRLTSLALSLTGVGGTHHGLFGGNRGRWLVSARRGYPDLALKLSDRDNDVSPRYYDLMAKVEWGLAPGNTVSIHALHAGDGLRYERRNNPSLSSSYDSDYVWARLRTGGSEAVRGETVVSWTRLTWNRGGSGRMDGFPFSLRDERELDRLAVRSEWSIAAGERLVLRGGVEGRRDDADYDYALTRQRNEVTGATQTTITRTTLSALALDGEAAGAFAAARVQPWQPLVVEPGVRFDRYEHVGDAELNPRINAALMLGGTTWRAAWGGHSQAHGVHELSVSDGERMLGRTERAEHRVLGVERALGRSVALRLEGYWREHTQVRPRWENLDNPYDLFPEAQADRVLLTPDRGRARGVELLLSSRGTGPWRWHASYAWSRAQERIGGRWVARSRDQRHAFSADVTWALNSRWQFSAGWRFHTGWPTTDVIYSLATLTNGRRVVVEANGAPYGLRMPDYHRLDVRATRRIPLKRGELRVFLDVFNVYDRANVMGYDHAVRVSGTQVLDEREAREQLPVLPSVGVAWEF